MSAPDVGQINDRAGGANGVKMFQRVKHNPALLRRVKGFSHWMSKGPAQKDAARWLHFFCIIPDDGDTDGGDTSLFNNTLDQSHGLIADSSAGCQQGDVDLFRP